MLRSAKLIPDWNSVRTKPKALEIEFQMVDKSKLELELVEPSWLNCNWELVHPDGIGIGISDWKEDMEIGATKEWMTWQHTSKSRSRKELKT